MLVPPSQCFFVKWRFKYNDHGGDNCILGGTTQGYTDQNSNTQRVNPHNLKAEHKHTNNEWRAWTCVWKNINRSNPKQKWLAMYWRFFSRTYLLEIDTSYLGVNGVLVGKLLSFLRSFLMNPYGWDLLSFWRLGIFTNNDLTALGVHDSFWAPVRFHCHLKKVGSEEVYDGYVCCLWVKKTQVI